jgi:phosphatidylserine/phosphatidylglycerophosphate/cardiolipin synthase-like enzyme
VDILYYPCDGDEVGEAPVRWLRRYTSFIATKRGLAAALHSGDSAFDAMFRLLVWRFYVTVTLLPWPRSPVEVVVRRKNRDPVYRWARETTTGLLGLSTHVHYIHSKFMLVDPLGEEPIVITGSANFSAPSTDGNDENMIAIRGNYRAADIYFTVFNRFSTTTTSAASPKCAASRTKTTPPASSSPRTTIGSRCTPPESSSASASTSCQTFIP